MKKVSIRFYNDRKVRAIWDDEKKQWLFSVLDIIGVLKNEDNYQKNKNYWKYLKNKLKIEKSELVSETNQLKLPSADGKKYLTDVMNFQQINILAKNFPAKSANRFIEWFTNNEDSIDGKSKNKAYSLWESTFYDSIEVGTTKGLQQIHAYLFGGLYDFAGKIRDKNIAKGGFQFAAVKFLTQTLNDIDQMPEINFNDIIDKYVEMNIAHPFREGNGRATRIWLDMILKKQINKCVDWSKVNKSAYLLAMKESVSASNKIKKLLKKALTDKINNREVYMKGIDYSYYYEEE
ncbi:MAG TPA: Fic family protein [Bacilli bacterium]|nr:Fic family protein [Bacilli bacterium]